jgi:uncharacterized membrane protein (UPF0127 family)
MTFVKQILSCFRAPQSRRFAALFLFAAAPVLAQEIPQPRLPTVTLAAGMHQLQAEVARTPQQRQIGMMMRTTMAPHEAMLFVFESASAQCFWMKNTLVPLSIAFVEDDGLIVNLADMKPLTETSHCSDKPVRYVLEVNQGWFAKRGIQPGFRLRGGPFKP